MVLIMAGELIAIVRVRGYFGMAPDRKDTLKMLNLPRAYNATLVHMNESYRGMLHVVKDYATWGPLSKAMVEKMLLKRGMVAGKRLSLSKKQAEIEKIAAEIIGGKSLTEVGIDRTFRLTPPSGGWKDRKQTRPKGDLGARPSMDELLGNMA